MRQSISTCRSWIRLHDLFLQKVLNYNYGSQKLTAFIIPYYIVYEFVIWSRLRSDIKDGKFALVHRLDPVKSCRGEPLLLADAQPEDTFLAWTH